MIDNNKEPDLWVALKDDLQPVEKNYSKKIIVPIIVIKTETIKKWWKRLWK